MNGKLNYLIVGMFVMCLVGNPLAMAATRTWDNEAIGDWKWDAAANWSADTIPGTGDTARITMIGADYALIESPVMADCKNLQVGWMKDDYTEGAAGELLMTGGSFTANRKGSTSKVGIREYGKFTIEGGIATFIGHLTVGEDPAVDVYPRGDGYLIVSGGSLDVGQSGTAKNLKVGLAGGKGLFDISGASTDINVWGTMTVGGGDGSDGTLNVSDGGTLDIGAPGSTKSLKVGSGGGTGSIDISGEFTSVNVTGTMTVGQGLDSDGTLTMSDGTLDIGAPDDAKNFRIGYQGTTGTATISGGTINATGHLNIGASVAGDPEVGATGTLFVSSGVINVGNVNTTAQLRVGRNRGTGFLVMSGGTINVINGDALVGSTFVQTIQDPFQEIPHPGTGTLTMTGGLLSISDANSLLIGLDGSTGLVELWGGTIEAGGLEIGPPGSGGKVDFQIGGLLLLEGNQILKVLDYIEDELFTVYGGVVAKDWFGWSYGYNVPGYDGKTIVAVTEVPEPATMMLLGFGGLALLRIRKRR